MVGNYYGTTFTWNKQRDKLYYLKECPINYLDGHQNKDGAGNLCFETGAGEVIWSVVHFHDDKYWPFILKMLKKGKWN